MIEDPILIELLNNHASEHVAKCYNELRAPENYEYPYISEWKTSEDGRLYKGLLCIIVKDNPSLGKVKQTIKWQNVYVHKRTGIVS